MRAVLTSLGIVFGVASVISMLSIGRGAQEEILEPELPIIDAHHHLWDLQAVHYPDRVLEEMLRIGRFGIGRFGVGRFGRSVVRRGVGHSGSTCRECPRS